MVLSLDVSLVPCDGVGGGLLVGSVLGRNVGITMGPTMEIFLGPPGRVGYGFI